MGVLVLASVAALLFVFVKITLRRRNGVSTASGRVVASGERSDRSSLATERILERLGSALFAFCMIAVFGYLGWSLWQGAAAVSNWTGVSTLLVFIILGVLTVGTMLAMAFSTALGDGVFADNVVGFIGTVALVALIVGLAYLGYANGYRLCGISPCR